MYLSEWGGAWDEGIELLTPVIEERRKMVGELPVSFRIHSKSAYAHDPVERSSFMGHDSCSWG